MSSIYVPDNPGTVSFTNGSTVINGIGTLFRGMSAGGLISIPGLGEMQLAEDPTSDTAAVGVVAWQGANTGSRPYQHVPRNSQATFSQKLVQLLEILAGGNVQSLAELTLAADSLLRGVGPGVIEAVDGSNVFELAALTLAAKKILATDASGNLIQSDLEDWAKQMLALAGAPNKLAYLDAGGDAALTDLTAKGRSILSKADNAAVLTEIGAQPADSDLTAIAALATTTFGRNLLTLANQSALLSAAGALSTSGGVITGNVTMRGNEVRLSLISPGSVYGTTIEAAVSDVSNFGLRFLDSGSEKVRIGGSGAPALHAYGALEVDGALSKGSGTFLIDHPLDPFNKDLVHGFVEAPRYDLIYRGVVQLGEGRAIVDIDAASNMTEGTFGALTINAVVTSLQNQDGFARLRPGAITGGRFEIICEDDTCTDTVAWVVIAERNDAFVKSELDPNTDSDGRFVPERDKPE